MMKMDKIGFGGGCHWCTEAVFQSIKGVEEVEQGYIKSKNYSDDFFEGILLKYDPDVISLESLIAIHLETHQSASNHGLRYKYLSAVYTFSQAQHVEATRILNKIRSNSEEKLITKAYDFSEFKASREAIRNYYKIDPKRPFCQKYIRPKLEKLEKGFSVYLKNE